MAKNVIGFMLVDAPHSALNNAGSDVGERTDNIVKVKLIRRGKDSYPYVSGQAVRYWWRDTLQSKFEWKLSPIERKEKIAFTAANPVEYADDDIFGYMRALKKDKKSEEKNKKEYVKDKTEEGGTVTRLSPLKNSPLISVISQIPTNDFGVMARHEGNPVPYEHEFYSTVLKGIFSLDLDRVGIFYGKEKTGYKNMYSKLEEIAKEKGAEKDGDRWVMPKDVRIKRAKEAIAVLPYISGGAKQTPHLTDVSPKFLVLAVLDGGNHIFMNIAKEDNRETTISIDALKEVINDYSDCLLTNIYIGRREGFMDEIDEKIKGLVKEYENKEKKIIYKSINEVVKDFVEEIPKFIK
ncbi:MAG: type I-B CRISPR-associated protein Cas7/Cst2/DevR [Candidatus Altiarchaeales archaeon HGW-Altiarchaeales-1]|nr:MAG: type I-B CRISPR-associated protein Cas7/Cst2/DevR [Candidatus Altiarchaeales archaeon HGW-Altiarchaeales-1]